MGKVPSQVLGPSASFLFWTLVPHFLLRDWLIREFEGNKVPVYCYDHFQPRLTHFPLYLLIGLVCCSLIRAKLFHSERTEIQLFHKFPQVEVYAHSFVIHSSRIHSFIHSALHSVASIPQFARV